MGCGYGSEGKMHSSLDCAFVPRCGTPTALGMTNLKDHPCCHPERSANERSEVSAQPRDLCIYYISAARGTYSRET
jgi:hypothetical protein